MIRRLPLFALAAAVAPALLLVACGDDDADDATPTQQATSAPTEPADTPVPTTAVETVPTSAGVAAGQDDPYGYDYDDVPLPTATPSGSGQPAATATSAPPAPQGAAVSVGDVFFNPPNVSVVAGATVTWTWSGSLPHSVVGSFNGQAVQSGTLTGSGSFQFTFASAGTLQYQCGIHGAGMSGTITVQ